jgi:hypothetical protein
MIFCIIVAMTSSTEIKLKLEKGEPEQPPETTKKFKKLALQISRNLGA